MSDNEMPQVRIGQITCRPADVAKAIETVDAAIKVASERWEKEKPELYLEKELEELRKAFVGK